jgi:maltose alpha-D-glucosyltransferase/alpha-amylase
LTDEIEGQIGDRGGQAAAAPQTSSSEPRAASKSEPDTLWYKDAIIYEAHVKAFHDADGDGVGDFRGLTEKLDYLTHLGITALWILPFYPSPLRDDGYDIGDYRNVHKNYGSLRDFKVLVREAHRRGLKVITELVINHTSDQHPWFQRARRAKPGSAWRNYYVWSDTPERYAGTRIIFCDTEVSNWTWDPVAGAFYWHRFFSHQPDLNFDNPRVVEEVAQIMRFWLEMGVDGLRLDAIPYLCERESTNNENLPETHAVIRALRARLDDGFGDRMLLAEANQWPEDVRPYFGDGDECHMAFHFPLMPRIYMALAGEDRYPITDILRQTPDIPANCQWAIFLRNHDELTLEMVSDRERDALWQFYANDPRARINLGIRRRLAPLLEGDRRKIELLNSLLMSMPGTPILYYGDEIGMGDNIYLGDRDGVRTPMQWSSDRNGGFSRADPQRLYLPPIMDPVYGYGVVNVEAQARQSSSLFNWTRRLIAARKQTKAFGRGEFVLLYPRNRKILAYLRRYERDVVLCVANLSAASQAVELDLAEYKGRVPVEFLGRTPFPPIGELPYLLTVHAYGFYWFLLAEEEQAPAWHEPYVTPLPEYQTLLVNAGWSGILGGAALETVVYRILHEYLPTQRWYAAKGRPLSRVALEDWTVVPDAGSGTLLAVATTELADGEQQRYSLPLAISWESGKEDLLAAMHGSVLAKVRRGPRIGVLHDATATGIIVRAALAAMREQAELTTERGSRFVFRKTSAFDDAIPAEPADVRRLGVEQSNTSLIVDDVGVFKLYRRLAPGIHPEVEIGRFLTEVAGYTNTPALLGSIERIDAEGMVSAIGILQAFVRNQGDAWAVTLDHLTRVLDQADMRLAPEGADPDAANASYWALAHKLGTRVAELHQAFALPVDDDAFRPEAVTAADVGRWRADVAALAARAREALMHVVADRSAVGHDTAAGILASWSLVEAMIREWPLPIDHLVKTRCHGDLHLGQVVVAGDDVCMLDFEGEPMRPLGERRGKFSPLRDVAGIVRSFDYAGHAALDRHPAAQGDAAPALTATVEAWRETSERLFLEAYRARAAGCPAVPAQDDAFGRWLDFFVLEKALYEIGYEAANRPAWLAIPIRGLQRIMVRHAPR